MAGLQQSGDVHLADADAVGDLLLGQAPAVPEPDDLLLALGEAPQGVAHELGERHPLADVAVVDGGVDGGLVERVRTEAGPDAVEGQQDLVHGDTEAVRDLACRGLPAQPLCELFTSAVGALPQLLEAPGHLHAPPVVAEVATDLAQDRRHRERGERGATLRVVPVECLQQADDPDLDQIVELDATVQVAATQ